MNKPNFGERLGTYLGIGLALVVLALLDALFIDVMWAMLIGKCMSFVVYKVALFICLVAYTMAWSIKRVVKD